MFVRFQPLRVEVPSLRPLFDVERSLEDVFGGILDTPALKTASGGPALEIRENEKETVVVAEIPGVAKEDVKISVHTGLLTISGTRKRPGAAEGAKVLRNEIAVGTFSRTFELPQSFDAEKVEATLVNGLLTITLPHSESARPRSIQIT